MTRAKTQDQEDFLTLQRIVLDMWNGAEGGDYGSPGLLPHGSPHWWLAIRDGGASP